MKCCSDTLGDCREAGTWHREEEARRKVAASVVVVVVVVVVVAAAAAAVEDIQEAEYDVDLEAARKWDFGDAQCCREW